jgi:two-component system, OmpR family, sensor histidine kinase RstB
LRLYLRLYLALLGSLFVVVLGATLVLHAHGAPVRQHSPVKVLLALLVVAGGVALAAFPIVRSLTRRLERLQQGAEALAVGDLAARVPVEGKDEVARLATSFNRAAVRIEELVGAHKLLLAQASHELRTPVTRIRLALDMIKDIDPQRRRGLESDIAELDDLIEDILLASRLDTVRSLEQRERVDLAGVVAEECARFGIADFDVVPAEIDGDSRLLRRLVRNLLENARLHGRPPTRVRVRSTAEAAELAVTDAGPGIPAADREHLFKPFHRRGGTVGHGLGLSLVRQIARQHGGEARYAPIEGMGAPGFVVTLPRR